LFIRTFPLCKHSFTDVHGWWCARLSARGIAFGRRFRDYQTGTDKFNVDLRVLGDRQLVKDLDVFNRAGLRVKKGDALGEDMIRRLGVES
jgi:hypothetical protein